MKFNKIIIFTLMLVLLTTFVYSETIIGPDYIKTNGIYSDNESSISVMNNTDIGGSNITDINALQFTSNLVEIGSNTTSASGTNSIAIGNNATTTGIYSLAIGSDATTSQEMSTAIGYSSSSLTRFGLAIGNGATSKGNYYATAIGRGALADGYKTLAIGYNANASGLNDDISIGSDSKASSSNSIAIGSYTSSNFDNGISFGLDSLSDSTNSIAIGYHSSAGGWYDDKGTIYNNNNSIALGANSYANATNAIALGSESNATGDYSLALGESSWIDDSDYSLALGHKTYVWGEGAVAIGGGIGVSTWGADADGVSALSMMNGSYAANDYSIAIGDTAYAMADNAIALGHGTSNSVANSFKVGSRYVTHTFLDTTLNVTGNTIIDGSLDLNYDNKIINLENGTSSQDAVTLSQLQEVNDSIVAGTDTWWNIVTSNYLINTTGVLNLNETKLNVNYQSEIASTNCTYGIANISDDGTVNCAAAQTAGTDDIWDISTSNYLVNETDVLYINETKLNLTIENVGNATYVPYTNADSNVNLGSYNLTTTGTLQSNSVNVTPLEGWIYTGNGGGLYWNSTHTCVVGPSGSLATATCNTN